MRPFHYSNGIFDIFDFIIVVCGSTKLQILNNKIQHSRGLFGSFDSSSSLLYRNDLIVFPSFSSDFFSF